MHTYAYNSSSSIYSWLLLQYTSILIAYDGITDLFAWCQMDALRPSALGGQWLWQRTTSRQMTTHIQTETQMWFHATQYVHRMLCRHKHIQYALHTRRTVWCMQQLLNLQIAAYDGQTLRIQQFAGCKKKAEED